jgi:hypothetical protein
MTFFLFSEVAKASKASLYLLFYILNCLLTGRIMLRSLRSLRMEIYRRGQSSKKGSKMDPLKVYPPQNYCYAMARANDWSYEKPYSLNYT